MDVCLTSTFNVVASIQFRFCFRSGCYSFLCVVFNQNSRANEMVRFSQLLFRIFMMLNILQFRCYSSRFPGSSFLFSQFQLVIFNSLINQCESNPNKIAVYPKPNPLTHSILMWAKFLRYQFSQHGKWNGWELDHEGPFK